MSYKGLYVNVSALIGYPVAQQHMLQYSRDNKFTTLSLYGIEKLLKKGNVTNATTKSLAAFIASAKTTYGITEVTGIGENFGFFTDVISKYNHVRTVPNERIDAYNLEYEFWNYATLYNESNYCEYYLNPNNLPCNVDSSYTFYKSQLTKLNALAKADHCLCETYVGQPGTARAAEMRPLLDRVLIHAYVKDAKDAYSYTKDRLKQYATAGKTNVIIIFSAELDFMGGWVMAHNLEQAATAYKAAYDADIQPWKANINLLGYQWFDYLRLNSLHA